MRKRIVLALITAALVLPIISVATVDAACAPGVPGVQLYENSNVSGDSRLFCGSVTNLDNYTHTQAGDCARGDPDPDGNDWNNCAGSVRVWFNSSTCLSLYHSTSYTGYMATIVGPQTGGWTNITSDLLTSFKFYAC